MRGDPITDPHEAAKRDLQTYARRLSRLRRSPTDQELAELARLKAKTR